MNKYTGLVKCENGYCQMDKNIKTGGCKKKKNIK